MYKSWCSVQLSLQRRVGSGLMRVWFGSVGKEWMAVVISGSNNKPFIRLESCCTWTRPHGVLVSSRPHEASTVVLRPDSLLGLHASREGSWAKAELF